VRHGGPFLREIAVNWSPQEYAAKRVAVDHTSTVSAWVRRNHPSSTVRGPGVAHAGRHDPAFACSAPPCVGAGPLDVGNAWRRRGVSFPRQPRRLVWWVPPIRSERQGSPVEISPWRAHRIWRPRSLIRAHREIGATSGACWVQIRLIVNGGVRGSNPDTLRQT